MSVVDVDFVTPKFISKEKLPLKFTVAVTESVRPCTVVRRVTPSRGKAQMKTGLPGQVKDVASFAVAMDLQRDTSVHNGEIIWEKLGLTLSNVGHILPIFW